jgi:hypothetical protein
MKPTPLSVRSGNTQCSSSGVYDNDAFERTSEHFHKNERSPRAVSPPPISFHLLALLFRITNAHTITAYTSTHRHIDCRTGKYENLQNLQTSAIQWRKTGAQMFGLDEKTTANTSSQSFAQKTTIVKLKATREHSENEKIWEIGHRRERQRL